MVTGAAEPMIEFTSRREKNDLPSEPWATCHTHWPYCCTIDPFGELVGLPVQQQRDSFAVLAAADLVEAGRLRDGCEQLVVLAEAELVQRRAVSERYALQLDDEPAAGALGEALGVEGEAVGDVEHRVCDPRERHPLVQPDRRPCVATLSERRSRSPERPGDHEEVAGAGSRAARHAGGAAKGSDREVQALGLARVPTDHGDAGLGHPLVELEHVVQLGVSGRRNGDDESERLGAARRQVAEVDRCGAETELAVGDPVEPEVDRLDERVLGDDEAFDDRRVVGDRPRQPPPLELRQEP